MEGFDSDDADDCDTGKHPSAQILALMEEGSNLQNPQTKHPNQPHLPPPRQLQRQNMRHRQRHNYEMGNHIQCSCTNIHRIPITAHTFDGCVPIVSERPAEEECIEDYGEAYMLRIVIAT